MHLVEFIYEMSGNILKPTHYRLCTLENTDSSHFFKQPNEQRQKYLKFVVPVHLVFLLLISVHHLWPCHTKKKSHEVRSGLRGGHFVSPWHPNQRPRKWLASLQSGGAASFKAMQLFVLSHLETLNNTKLSSIPFRWLSHLTWCTFFSIILYIYLRCFTTL